MYIILHTLYIYHRAKIRHDLRHNITNSSSVMETNTYNVVHGDRVYDNPSPDIWKVDATSPPPPIKKNIAEQFLPMHYHNTFQFFLINVIHK